MIVFVDGDVPCRVDSRRAVKSWIKRVVSLYDYRVGDISIVSCSDDELLKYNRTYLDHDTYTDIITFDNSDQNVLSGDLLISFERVSENAGIQGVVFREELRRVIIHGVLHLIGFKDKQPEEAQAMRHAEDEALALFHVEQRG